MTNRVNSRLRVSACLVWLRSFVILNFFGMPIRQLKASLGAALFALLFVEVAGAQVPVVTAVNDVATVAGGTVGATTVLSGNDVFPAGSVFTVRTGSTCTSPVSVSTGGIATYTVPASGTCTVNYRLCAPAPNTTVCSNATLTVTIAVAGDDDSFPFAILIKALTPVCSAFTAAPASVLSGGNIALAATCTNSPTAYEWYRGTTLLGTTTTATFPTIAPTTVGTYEYAVVAKRGNIPSLRKTANVNVLTAPPLSVSTVTNTTVNTPVSIQGTFNAPANSASIRVSAGNNLIVNLPNISGSFSTSWTPNQSGVYQLNVQAISNSNSQVLASQFIDIAVADLPAATALAIPGTSSTGATAGSFAVSDSGAAQFSIPVTIAPGTAGMQPAVSLNYSSQGGNGHVGVGFSIGGMSAVTRCPKTVAQDGFKTGINYDADKNNDAFCLDGQRLIEVSRRMGTDPNWRTVDIIEYRTEIDRFDRIEGYSERLGVLTGPFTFRVYSKSGQIMDYGSRWWAINRGASQALSDAERGNTVRTWPLDRVLDRNGNYYAIDYAGTQVEQSVPLTNLLVANAVAPIGAFPAGEIYPTQITYTLRTAAPSVTNVNRVVFKYEDRPTNDRHVLFDSGAAQFVLTKRLISVATYLDGGVATEPGTYPVYPLCDQPNGGGCGAVIRQYNLTYDTTPATTRSRLSSVQECASGVCLPATTFNWSGGLASFVGPARNPANVGGADVMLLENLKQPT